MPSTPPATSTGTVRMHTTSQDELRKLLGLDGDERVTHISLSTDGNPDGTVFVHVEKAN